MRTMITVFTLFIYGALLSGCAVSPANNEFYGMTERRNIEAQTERANIAAETERAAIAATVEAERVAGNVAMRQSTDASNAAIAATNARASIMNNQAWSSAVVIMVLLVSLAAVAGTLFYWFGRIRVEVISSTAQIAISQNKLIFDAGPRGGETSMSMSKFIRDHDPGKQSIVVYEGGETYGALNNQLIKLERNQ